MPGLKMLWWLVAAVNLFPIVSAISHCSIGSCAVPVISEHFNGTRRSEDNCRFYGSSGLCNDLLADPNFWNVTETRKCSPQELSVDVYPYIYRHPLFFPVVRVNISLLLLESDRITRFAAIQLQCLHEPHQIQYCNQSKIPCRAIDFRSVDQANLTLDFPVPFYFDCFGPITDFSIFRVNVSLYPQLCRNSYPILFAGIQHQSGSPAPELWLPFVMIDDSDPNGVWVRFSRPPESLRFSEIIVDLHEAEKEVIGNKLQQMVVPMKLNKSGAFFQDLTKGVYIAKVRGVHYGCLQNECPAQTINFVLAEDHWSEEHRTALSFRSVSAPISIGVTTGCLLVVLLFLGVLGGLRWKRSRQPLGFLSFSGRPRVVVLYSDDCDAHRHTVLALAAYLRDSAACEVSLDEWAGHHQESMTDWLWTQLGVADVYYLLVFSTGTQVTLAAPPTQALRPRRPWPETFLPAVRFVLEKILAELNRPGTFGRTSLRRYVGVTFSYSPASCAPDHLRLLGCPQFRLPNELKKLICHLHGINEASVDDHCPLHSQPLEGAIGSAELWMRQHPEWLQSRLIPAAESLEANDSDAILRSLANDYQVELMGTGGQPLNSDYRTIATYEAGRPVKFPLLARDTEDEENDSQPRFPLIPFDDDT